MFEAKKPTSVLVSNRADDTSSINVPLNDMSIKPPIVQHAPFEVNCITFFQAPQVGFLERLIDSGGPVTPISQLCDGEANPIMTNTLINLELFADLAQNEQMMVRPVSHDALNHTKGFNYSGEHDRDFRIIGFRIVGF